MLRKLISITFLVLLALGTLSSQELSDADEHFAAGRYTEALAAYSKWLENHCGSESAKTKNPELVQSADFAAVLRKTALLTETYESALSLLSEYSDRATIEERAAILMDIARVEEAAGRYEDAQRHFERAAFLIPGKQIFDALLESARLLLEFGQYAKADAHARAVVSGANDFGLRLRGNLLLSRIKAARGEYEAALGIIHAYDVDKLPAEGLLWLYRISSYLSDEEGAKAALSRLSTDYLDSPEFRLVRADVDKESMGSLDADPLVVEKPTPTTILGLLSPVVDAEDTEAGLPLSEDTTIPNDATVSDRGSSTNNTQTERAAGMLYIQTGSFVDKENAEYFAVDLDAAGFDTSILEALVKGKRYYRVVVPVLTNELDRTILLLKEKGYEGYPLYSE